MKYFELEFSEDEKIEIEKLKNFHKEERLNSSVKGRIESFLTQKFLSKEKMQKVVEEKIEYYNDQINKRIPSKPDLKFYELVYDKIISSEKNLKVKIKEKLITEYNSKYNFDSLWKIINKIYEDIKKQIDDPEIEKKIFSEIEKQIINKHVRLCIYDCLSLLIKHYQEGNIDYKILIIILDAYCQRLRKDINLEPWIGVTKSVINNFGKIEENNEEFRNIIQEKIKNLNEKYLPISLDNSDNNIENLVTLLIKGINKLQENSDRESFIKDLKSGKKKDESGFRNWFETYFTGAEFEAVPEALKGNGRIDLKLKSKNNEYKIEFKGWWNNDKTQIVEQIYGYLTDFNENGIIFIINHLKEKDILDEYEKIVVSDKMCYMPETWQDIKFQNTNFIYYKSKHLFGINPKTIYHFIFRIHP
jgi:hypothetical protein